MAYNADGDVQYHVSAKDLQQEDTGFPFGTTFVKDPVSGTIQAMVLNSTADTLGRAVIYDPASVVAVGGAASYVPSYEDSVLFAALRK